MTHCMSMSPTDKALFLHDGYINLWDGIYVSVASEGKDAAVDALGLLWRVSDPDQGLGAGSLAHDVIVLGVSS